MVNTLGSVSIQLIGTTFQFTGPALGAFNASAEFINDGGDFLAFSPTGISQFMFAVFIDRIPVEEESASPDILGVYGSITAIPEPSSAALLGGFGALGLVGLRRRRG